MTVAAVAISLGAVSAAQAATVTVGFPFTQPHNEGYLGNNGDTAMVANTTLSEPGANVASPVSGTIIQWRAVPLGTGEYALRVLRPAGGGAYTGAGRSPQNITATGDQTFSASLPIQAGDLIGLELPNDQGVAGDSLYVPGGVWSLWAPALAEGAQGAPFDTFTNQELAFNAVVQYADTASGTTPKGCKKKKHKRSASAAKKCKKKKKH